MGEAETFYAVRVRLRGGRECWLGLGVHELETDTSPFLFETGKQAFDCARGYRDVVAWTVTPVTMPTVALPDPPPPKPARMVMHCSRCVGRRWTFPADGAAEHACARCGERLTRGRGPNRKVRRCLRPKS
jgi:hypothetical protein